MLARLTVHFPFHPTRSFLVHGDVETVIGRDPDCDIVLNDDRVSRRHARLLFAESDWRLVDLDSTNGTLVDGHPLRDAPLTREGWISFGGLLARFEHSNPERENAALRRREERYRTSISLQRELDPSLGLRQLLERLLDSVLRLSGADRGVVFLTRENGELEIVARRALSDSDLVAEGFSGSVGAIRRVVATARAVAVSDALSDSFLRERESVIEGGIRALVCLPLAAAGRLTGLIYADSHEPGAAFDELDVDILQALASHAALAIAVARTNRELKDMAELLPDAESGDGVTASSWSRVLAHHDARSRKVS